MCAPQVKKLNSSNKKGNPMHELFCIHAGFKKGSHSRDVIYRHHTLIIQALMVDSTNHLWIQWGTIVSSSFYFVNCVKNSCSKIVGVVLRFLFFCFWFVKPSNSFSLSLSFLGDLKLQGSMTLLPKGRWKWKNSNH